jgi:hypothetical protein
LLGLLLNSEDGISIFFFEMPLIYETRVKGKVVLETATLLEFQRKVKMLAVHCGLKATLK